MANCNSKIGFANVHLFVLNVGLAIEASLFSQSLFIFGVILFFLFWGQLISRNKNKDIYGIKIFLSLFAIYLVYGIVTHFSIVRNPDVDCFISIDQFTFYSSSKELGELDWGNMVESTFTQFKYLDAPFAFMGFGVLYKIGNYFQCSDILFFQKLHVIFLTALIPVFIYKTILEIDTGKSKIYNSLILFGVFTPLMSYSVQLMRDIHICFLYTYSVFIVLKKRVKFRYFILFLLIIITTFIRIENGIFALGFLCWRFVLDYSQLSKIKKIFLISVGLFILIWGIGYVWEMMSDVLGRFREDDLAAASDSSLGAKLRSLPVPLNLILPAVFSQIMPFPIWWNMMSDHGGYLLVLTPFIPLFWTYVWGIILFALIYHRGELKKYRAVCGLLAMAGLYIILTVIGEVNPRRIMAVYPIVFLVYCFYKDCVTRKVKYQFVFFIGIVFIALHGIYLGIK